MTKQQIIELQKRIGTEPDGFWGRNSIDACKKHLTNLMPKPHPFPIQTEEEVTAYFGPHGVNGGYMPPTKRITLPFTIYYDGSPVRTLSPHEKCADSLLAVFERLAVAFPTKAARDAAGISVYNGIYNPRKMRGGDAWSMHAWAIAIDLDAGRNGNKTHWPTKATMPLEVMECFVQEGWMPAGAFWGRDAMHFQATQ